MSATTSSSQPWEKIKIIGRGGSSTVYLGRLLNSDEHVAVKEIQVDGLTKEQVLAIGAEVDTMKILRHQNIIKYIGTEQVASNFYIFMEYADGGSLRQLYQRHGALTEAQASFGTWCVLHGLRYLHSNGIAHRDIKGANVLLTKSGDMKLADFGASKRFETESIVSGLKGTPQWMAPEVIKGTQLTTGWMNADVWSVGCTVVEMLTGKIPYAEFENPMTAMYHIANGKKPSFGNCAVSESAKDFVDVCCAVEPEQRLTVEQLLMHPFVKQANPDARLDFQHFFAEAIDDSISTVDNSPPSGPPPPPPTEPDPDVPSRAPNPFSTAEALLQLQTTPVIRSGRKVTDSDDTIRFDGNKKSDNPKSSTHRRNSDLPPTPATTTTVRRSKDLTKSSEGATVRALAAANDSMSDMSISGDTVPAASDGKTGKSPSGVDLVLPEKVVRANMKKREVSPNQPLVPNVERIVTRQDSDRTVRRGETATATPRDDTRESKKNGVRGTDDSKVENSKSLKPTPPPSRAPITDSNTTTTQSSKSENDTSTHSSERLDSFGDLPTRSSKVNALIYTLYNCVILRQEKSPPRDVRPSAPLSGEKLRFTKFDADALEKISHSGAAAIRKKALHALDNGHDDRKAVKRGNYRSKSAGVAVGTVHMPQTMLPPMTLTPKISYQKTIPALQLRVIQSAPSVSRSVNLPPIASSKTPKHRLQSTSALSYNVQEEFSPKVKYGTLPNPSKDEDDGVPLAPRAPL